MLRRTVAQFRFLLCAVPLLLTVLADPAWAQAEPFVVEEIRFDGLVAIAPSTALASIDIAKGDVADEASIARTIASLYSTGLFSEVSVFRADGNVLLIKIVENRTINSVRLVNTDTINADDLLKILEQVGIGVGRIYSTSMKGVIQRIVDRLFAQKSRYLTVSSVTTVPLERNRIDIVITVVDSRSARIAKINIRGAESFSEAELLDLFELKTKGLVSTWFDVDIYSEEALDGDLERLRSHYFNAGFVRFQVKSSDIRLVADTADIEIEITISEGDRYRFGEPAIIGPNPLPADLIEELKSYQAGDFFSDVASIDYARRLRDALRDVGYAFAKVESQTAINDEQQQVVVSYNMEPGRIVLVNQIEFIGNRETRDLVLRRQMALLEGAAYSRAKLETSLVRLRRTGYLNSVQAVERKLSDELIDIDIVVEEDSYGILLFGVGYSNVDRVSFDASISRRNVLGSGNDFSASVKYTKKESKLNFQLREDFITDTGIGRNLDLNFSEIKPSQDNSKDYAARKIGLMVTYDVPLNDDWSWVASFGLEHSRLLSPEKIRVNSDADSNGALDYLSKYGSSAIGANYGLGIVRDTRDSAYLPQDGSIVSAGLQLAAPPGKLRHGSVSLSGRIYRLIVDDIVAEVNSRLEYGFDYGNGVYPYYSRYYLRSSDLRGFNPYRVGPRDSDTNNSIGGRLLSASRIEINRPVGSDKLNLRGGVFLNVASLWSRPSDFRFSDFRVSAGVVLRVRTPFAPLVISYGFPVIKKRGDPLQKFQFSLGG